MAYTINRRLGELIDSTGQLNDGKIPNDYINGDHIADNTITSSMLHTTFSVPAASLTGIDTDDVSEGATNVYYTDARARGAISVSGSLSYDSGTGVVSYTTPTTIASLSNHTTDALTEGSTNLYYTTARFDTAFSGKSTTDLSEGTNLYYTDARVGSYLTANNYATQSYVSTAISNLVDSSPATLDTLNELAAALGDDPNFATTVSTNIGAKVSKSGDTMTGTLNFSSGTLDLRGAPALDHDGTSLYIKAGGDLNLYPGNSQKGYFGSSFFWWSQDIRIGSSTGATNQTGIIKNGSTTYGLGLFTWGDSVPVFIGGSAVNLRTESGAGIPLQINGTTVIDSSRNLTNIASLNLAGYSVNNPQELEWYGTGAYAYDATNGVRYYWVKIGQLPTDGGKAFVEIEVTGDTNYAFYGAAKLGASSWNSNSISLTLESIADNCTIQAGIDNSRNLWIKANAPWDHRFKWRWLESNGVVVNETEASFAKTFTAPDGVVSTGQSARFTQGSVSNTAVVNSGKYFGDIYARGNVTAYASDARLKENVTTITNALNKVNQLRGVEFDWREDSREVGFYPTLKHETGVIAQEVQAVIPDAVVPAPFDNDYLTVHKDKIVPLLIEAIKELKAEVDSLKAELAEK